MRFAGLTALDVHADSTTVLTGSEDGCACLSNIQSGRLLGRLTGTLRHATIELPPCLLWQLESEPITCSLTSASLRTGHNDSIEAVQISSTMPYSATGSVDGNLIIWDNTTLSVRSTCTHPEVTLICKIFVLLAECQRRTQAYVKNFPNVQAVVKLVLHPSKPLVFTACLDGVARCWDARTGTNHTPCLLSCNILSDSATCHHGFCKSSLHCRSIMPT